MTKKSPTALAAAARRSGPRPDAGRAARAQGVAGQGVCHPQGEDILELDWDDAGQVDVVSLELGYGLIPMVDADGGGRLLNRIKGIRKKLSSEMGFLLPAIRIRDNLDNPPDTYKIVIK